MNPGILVPTKSFDNAKKRLEPVLNQNERRQLAEAMFKDVLCQLTLKENSAAVFVVTGDSRVSHVGSSFGVEILMEREEKGENLAVRFALAEITKRGFDTVLVIPADLPLIDSSDVAQLLNQINCPPVARIVPSMDQLGTNALLLAPPNLIRPRFGYESFRYHLNQLQQLKIETEVIENDRIGLDIDEPKDLIYFMQHAVQGESYKVLSRIPLQNRTIHVT